MKTVKQGMTPWFKMPEQEPTRVGAYQVAERDNVEDDKRAADLGRGSAWYSYWNGKKFGYLCLSAARASSMNYNTKAVVVEWRGLTK